MVRLLSNISQNDDVKMWLKQRSGTLATGECVIAVFRYSQVVKSSFSLLCFLFLCKYNLKAILKIIF